MQLSNRSLVFSLLLAFVLSQYACKKTDDITGGTVANNSDISSVYTSGTPEGGTETAYNEDDLIENSAFTSVVNIQYGSEIVVANPLENNGVSVTVNGGDVTVESTVKEVEYVLTGTTAGGSFKIYSSNKFKLTLDNISITSSNGPAINIQSSKRVFVNVPENTSSSLTDAAIYTEVAGEDMKATLFSEGQLIFTGSGNLSVAGRYKHAIASDDYIRVVNTNITIPSAVTDGIHTNDAFIADGGSFNITAESDGIECEEGFIVINDGVFVLNTGDDGIAASYEDGDAAITPYVTINNGDITVNSAAGEGIESKSVLTINNGKIVTNTADDGLNAGTAIYINGGDIYSKSTGNDAMDSNGTFTITGGKVVAVGSGQPEGGIDADNNTFKITGGIVVGIGGTTTSPTASVSTVPGVIMGAGEASKIVHIEDADGNEVLTFLAPVSYSTLLFASSKMKTNTTYTVYTGGSVTGGTDFYGLYTSGTYSGGVSGSTFTTSGMVTQIGGSTGPGGGGGRP